MNCIYSLPCFCSDFNDIVSKFLCLVWTWFKYLYINSKGTVNCIQTPIKNLLTFTSEYLVKYCNFYIYLISLEKVSPAFKLTENLLHKGLWTFLFLKKGNLITNQLLSYTYQKIVLTIWQNMKISKTQKYQFSNSLVN